MTEDTTPTCDMIEGCTEPVTYLDAKGYVYCTKHGLERQSYQRCRKLRPAELAKVRRGEALEAY
jgi:hypothetical protein